MVRMKCRFRRIIYPSSESDVRNDQYMVALYEAIPPLHTKSGVLNEFKAVGYALPRIANFLCILQGHWDKGKYGLQFLVKDYEDVIEPTKEGIVTYLSSGQIKGIGRGLAERIFDRFGMESLSVLDNEPQRLLEIKGISNKKLARIRESYDANRGARDLISFLRPYGVSPQKAVSIYQEHGRDVLGVIQKNPYKLCSLAGIGFRSTDQIAAQLGLPGDAPERLQEALLYSLHEAENRGHLCIRRDELISLTYKLLSECGRAVSADYIRGQANNLYCKRKILIYDDDMCFREETWDAEESVAFRLATLLDAGFTVLDYDLDKEIRREETECLKFRLDKSQKAAVRMALTNPISIITGGPGTGKTSIQKVIIDIFRRHNSQSGKNILCCAPTGRAARRLEEATDTEAFTIHSALKIDTTGKMRGVDELDADLILVDEISMIDVYVARHLFNAVRKGSHLILTGDPDQLPSVGPGAVLSELLKSGCIPYVCLDCVHRQAAGSRIAINARLIKHGNIALELGKDFEIIESPCITDSARLIERLYLDEVARFGVDQVALLTPLRKRTETCADELNRRIQQLVNPPAPDKPEIRRGKNVFRVKDRVMQIKNNDFASNGDLGQITSIKANSDGDLTMKIDMGYDVKPCYDESDIPILDLGYATTIHKSQGGQYDSVILNLHQAHRGMLKRPLIYTAITRAKKHVVIVGEMSAIVQAINSLETEHRGTCLASRIKLLIQISKGGTTNETIQN